MLIPLQPWGRPWLQRQLASLPSADTVLPVGPPPPFFLRWCLPLVSLPCPHSPPTAACPPASLHSRPGLGALLVARTAPLWLPAPLKVSFHRSARRPLPCPAGPSGFLEDSSTGSFLPLALLADLSFPYILCPASSLARPLVSHRPPALPGDKAHPVSPLLHLPSQASSVLAFNFFFCPEGALAPTFPALGSGLHFSSARSIRTTHFPVCLHCYKIYFYSKRCFPALSQHFPSAVQYCGIGGP